MNHRDIVVIGASAGGLEATCKLARSLPIEFPAAVLVVLHTSRDSPGLLAELIGHASNLPVSYAEAGQAPRRGHITIAPPDRHLVISEEATFELDAGPKVRNSRPAADRLFESAAKVYGERVIGVVMTGGDHDGTNGLSAVKKAGGMCIVQNPDEALDPSMPLSALDNDESHYCSTLDDMSDLLLALARGETPATDLNPSMTAT